MKRSIFIIGVLGWTLGSLAQPLALDTLTISADRLHNFGIGASLRIIDSAALQAFTAQTLSELLYQQQGLMIQQYGPGQLASPSLRGTAASHTAVLWEGFPLQSSFNGQVDLSLFPVGFAEEITVMPGANAALWGGGALGGTIFLNQSQRWQKGWQGGLQTQIGSNGFHYEGVRVQWGGDNIQVKTQLFHRQARNDFAYLPPGKETPLRQTHAAFQQWGLMQSIHTRVSPRQEITAHLWGQDNQREIPRFATQQDQSLRPLLKWQYLGDRVQWKVRSAWIAETLHYQDSVAGIDSPFSSQNWISEGEGNWQIGAHKLQVGAHLSRAEGRSAILAPVPLVEYRPALFAAWSLQKPAWKLSAQLRQAWTGGQIDPIVPALGLEWRPFSVWKLRARAARNYRMPTFNDRYWQPGGNPDLLPELGWSGEVGTDLLGKRQSLHLTLYSGLIANWIQWVPGPAYWSPRNVQQVWNRGVETRWLGEHTWDKLAASWQLNYQFTAISSYQKEPGGPLQPGLQQIFVPLHQAQVQLQVQYARVFLQVGNTLTGKRYVARDHSDFLPAHLLGYVNLLYPLQLKNKTWELSARVDNLWNTDYQLLPGRPMPLRTYLLGLSIRLKP